MPEPQGGKPDRADTRGPGGHRGKHQPQRNRNHGGGGPVAAAIVLKGAPARGNVAAEQRRR